MMDEAQIAAAASALDGAERTRRQIGLLSVKYPQMDMDDAYRVQARWVAHKLDSAGGHKRSRIGWKIGLTSRAMQQALNITTPDSGVLLDDMRFASGDTVPPGRFIQPRVEAELAFVLKHDLAGPHLSIENVLAATDYVAPALEILDTRILRADPATGKTRTIVDTIAANAANAGIVLGKQRFNPETLDLRWVGAIAAKNGTVEETGLAAGVLNHPALGIVWLAQRLAHYDGHLSSGDIVLAGSFIRPIETAPGDMISADFGPRGTVEIEFGT